MLLQQRHDSALNLLGLRARMFGIATPSYFYKSCGRALNLIAAAPLEDKVEIMTVLIYIEPRKLRPLPTSSYSMFVQIETMFDCLCSNNRLDGPLENFA